MRARSVVGVFGCVAFALVGPWACFNQPDTDFTDFQGRVANFPKAVVEASAPIEAGPLPQQAVEGTYYGACLSELAFNQITKIFNLYATTKFTPAASGGGGTFEIVAHTLKVVNNQPPPKVETANLVGDPITGAAVPLSADSKFTYELGRVTFPGTANPISGSDVIITGTKLQGDYFSKDRFCARLVGHVEQPAAAARDLDIEKNVCIFVPIKDGDDTPKFTLPDFQASTCPL